MALGRSSRHASPRILVGLGETAGYCARLAEGLRAIGLRADHVNLGTDPMRYGTATNPGRVRLTRWLGARRRNGPGPRAAWAMLHRMALVWLFLDAVARYDAFILRAGDSFFVLRDLPLLRRLGKTVVVVFFGSDSRPSYLNGAEIEAGQDGATAARLTAAKRRMVARTERHASHVVCHPMSAQLHRRPFVAFLELGIPREVPPSVPPPRSDGPLRLLHAPSRRHGKGTDRLRTAVEEVAASGIDVELRVLSGVRNAEVLAAIGQCDVVIDQLYSDTPMAALAAEAAAVGRPAIVGGHGWDELRAITRSEVLPPAFTCHPDDLADAIRHLATHDGERLALGQSAQRFVEGRWTPEAVAERYLALLRGELPAECWIDPARVGYVLGAGAPLEAVRESVRAVIDARGVAGLALDDRPDLVDRLTGLVARRGEEAS